uniref:Uncharacterized protein n=1 Tax=Anopheles maculatus TaxID=74869 RepID=A0A182SJ38_9DIPT
MIDRGVTLTSNTCRRVSCDERITTNPKKSEQNFTPCDKEAVFRAESGPTSGGGGGRGQEASVKCDPNSVSLLAEDSSFSNVASSTTTAATPPVPEQERHRCRQKAVVAASVSTSILKSRLNASAEDTTTVPTKRLPTAKVRPRDIDSLDIDSNEISTDNSIINSANSPFTADTHLININNRTANNNYIVNNDTDYTNSTNAVTIFVIKTVLPDD